MLRVTDPDDPRRRIVALLANQGPLFAQLGEFLTSEESMREVFQHEDFGCSYASQVPDEFAFIVEGVIKADDQPGRPKLLIAARRSQIRVLPDGTDDQAE